MLIFQEHLKFCFLYTPWCETQNANTGKKKNSPKVFVCIYFQIIFPRDVITVHGNICTQTPQKYAITRLTVHCTSTFGTVSHLIL